jgi:DNA-binding MarR family transcriptional regulator
LSAAATSTAIQRLVAAGLLTRTEDAADRRRAVLVLTEAATTRLDQVYGPLADQGRRLLAGYGPDALAVIERFLADGVEHQLRQARRIRTTWGEAG